MNFNTMSTLLAVSSAHDTVHIFNLGPQKSSSSPNGKSGPQLSPSPSIDSRDGSQGMEGGYEAFIDGKKGGGMTGTAQTPTRVASDQQHRQSKVALKDGEGLPDAEVLARSEFLLPLDADTVQMYNRVLNW